MWKNLVDIDSLQKIILFHHILANNWLQPPNFYVFWLWNNFYNSMQASYKKALPDDAWSGSSSI